MMLRMALISPHLLLLCPAGIQSSGNNQQNCISYRTAISAFPKTSQFRDYQQISQPKAHLCPSLWLPGWIHSQLALLSRRRENQKSSRHFCASLTQQNPAEGPSSCPSPPSTGEKQEQLQPRAPTEPFPPSSGRAEAITAFPFCTREPFPSLGSPFSPEPSLGTPKRQEICWFVRT